MQRGPFQRLPNNVDSRTELILVRERVHDVEAAAEIDGELFEWFPFILQIESVEIAVFAGVIDNAQGNVAGLVAIGIDRENQCRRSDGGMLRGYKESAAERMLIVEFVARVQRDAIRENVAINARGDAIENKIAGIIGPKQDRAIKGKNRRLHVEIVDLLLIGENGICILLDLGLVERSGIEFRSSHVDELWRLAGIIRNFEITVITAGQQYESAGVVDNVRRIPKHSILIGVVVDRISGTRWILDPDAVMQVTPGDVIIHLPRHTAVLKTRHNCVEASAIDRCIGLLENGAALRMDIDYARIAKSKLCRQRAGNERNVVREAGLQYLAKTRNTFRQKHVVDAVLQICMFAADMKLPERILRDTWEA